MKPKIFRFSTSTRAGGNFGLPNKQGDGAGPENRATSAGRAEAVLRVYSHETGLRFDDPDDRISIVDILTDLRLFVDGEGKNMEWDGIMHTAMWHAAEEIKSLDE